MRSCKRVWPNAAILMIEGHPQRAEALRAIALHYDNVTAAQALLGCSDREDVPFYEQESASSVLPESAKQDQFSVQLPMRTLDAITRNTRFQRPDLIKLDVQGYEIEVLKGGRETLRFASVVLIEVNFLPIYRGTPLLKEVIAFLGDAEFAAYDISGLIRRPLDGALWQADFVFVRNGSALVASDRYE
jgi:FkbM family methyltransferase